MISLYESYVGTTVKLVFDNSRFKNLPYLTRIKAVDGQNILIGPFVLYDPAYGETESKLLAKLISAEEIIADSANILDENCLLQERGLENVIREAIVNTAVIAACTPVFKKQK